jgi:hypothetical protein
MQANWIAENHAAFAVVDGSNYATIVCDYTTGARCNRRTGDRWVTARG